MAVDSPGNGAPDLLVQHAALESATTGQLPEQVAQLGRTRETLLSRTVPAEWLGRLPGSQTAAASHAGNVAESARQLEAAAKRLDEIIVAVRGTNTGSRAFAEAEAKKQQEQEVQLAQATDQLGQRAKAFAVLKEVEKQHPISVAAVARNQLEDFLWVGETSSATIGDHYDATETREMLAKAPTDENLRAFAARETAYWRAQAWESPGSAWAGVLLGEDWRTSLLQSSREDWLAELSEAQRADALRQIAPPPPY